MKSSDSKKLRKTFDIDRTIHADVSVHEPKEKQESRVILHIPIPISTDTGLLDDTFQENEKQIEIPVPFEPNTQFANLEQSPQITQTFLKNQKMELTSLSQFFKTEENQQSIIPFETSVLKQVQNTEQIQTNGFLQSASIEIPIERYIEIWRHSQPRNCETITSSVCHWCCHNFKMEPIGIPMMYRKGKFWIRGTYCSWACAAAAILHDHSKWNYQPYESYSLLHLLYRKIHGTNTPISFFIKPAPAKETLQLFGGVLTIEEFRQSTFIEDRKLECFYPPMASMVSTVEEIFVERSSKKKVPFLSRFHAEEEETKSKVLKTGKNPVPIETHPVASIWLGKGLGGSQDLENQK